MKYLYGSLACLLGLAASSSVLAEKLYKYQGEDGRWHYTDRMPTADKSAEEIHIKASNEVALFDKVWVREGTGSSPRLTVVNNYHGPIEAYLTVSCKQCEVSPARQVVVPVAADSEELAVEITPHAYRWNADYTIAISFGDPKAVPDEDAVYGLPVPTNKYFLVSQGVNGPFSHTDEYNRYALDIEMDIGTPVLAARDGVIMAVEEDYKKAGVHEDYADKANVIYILHDDGTIALYAHLDMHSALVRPGERVRRGDVIARSGNTGFSTGPHLHFNVQKNFGGGEKSIPVRFDKGNGESFIPVAGQEFKHDLDGVVELRLRNEHGELYALSLKEQNKVDQEESGTDSIEEIFTGMAESVRMIFQDFVGDADGG